VATDLDLEWRVDWLVTRGTDRSRAELLCRRTDALLELRRLWALTQFDSDFADFAQRPDVADLSKEIAKLGEVLQL
jgi:hypothetical protein